METKYELLCDGIKQSPKRWLVTGVAGFIGSHILEQLLRLGQLVTGLDNLSTGNLNNLESVKKIVGEKPWSNFTFIQGDIRDREFCIQSCDKIDYVVHQAALGSVPRSIADPITTNEVNVGGFVNMLFSAYKSGVKRFVYASSSSVYGDNPDLPKRETVLGRLMSPYAVSKRANELYAEAFSSVYKIPVIGLRYFNVFGPRQDPNGPYAAVIPRWIHNLIENNVCEINGDGETSRDFCFVANVVQANILAILAPENAFGNIYNVAVGQTTSLNVLHSSIAEQVYLTKGSKHDRLAPQYLPFRTGDIRHSLADISLVKERLGYSPTHTLVEGLKLTIKSYFN